MYLTKGNRRQHGPFRRSEPFHINVTWLTSIIDLLFSVNSARVSEDKIIPPPGNILSDGTITVPVVNWNFIPVPHSSFSPQPTVLKNWKVRRTFKYQHLLSLMLSHLPVFFVWEKLCPPKCDPSSKLETSHLTRMNRSPLIDRVKIQKGVLEGESVFVLSISPFVCARDRRTAASQKRYIH